MSYVERRLHSIYKCTLNLTLICIMTMGAVLAIRYHEIYSTSNIEVTSDNKMKINANEPPNFLEEYLRKGKIKVARAGEKFRKTLGVSNIDTSQESSPTQIKEDKPANTQGRK